MAQGDPSTANQPADHEVPSDTAIRTQLVRILRSSDFAQSERIKSFLDYVVQETLSGRADRLKEYSIASEVFGRGEDFDPQTSTVVRVEAGRLRRRLERYYLTEGKADQIRIELPKGTYVPVFRRAQPVATKRPSVTGDTALALPTGPSIAVLPFANLSGDPGQEFFADGITEEIINDLTRFADLRVVARHSTFKYKGERLDIRDVGRDLGVRYVLEGSVRRGGDVVRVTGQLIDAADGSHLFSETYDRDLSAQNILEIQDDISDRLVAAVGQPYGVIARSSARRSKGTASQHLDAYGAVLRFYEYWVSHSPERHRTVRAALERAVELDPGYASAWAALAEVTLDEVRFSFNPRGDGDPLDRALAAAQRAVKLDPENSMAYHFLFSVHFHRREPDEFKAAAERAVALNPNHADMLADYGLMLAFCGEWDRGVALSDKAIALSPTHPGWFHVAALYDHYHKGDYEAALAKAKLLQMPDFYSTHLIFAMCYGQLGRVQEASAARERLLEIAPDVCTRYWQRTDLWHQCDDLAQHIVEGLRKAGLAVPERM